MKSLNIHLENSVIYLDYYLQYDCTRYVFFVMSDVLMFPETNRYSLGIL